MSMTEASGPILYTTVLGALTTQWQSREEIERQVGGTCISQLARLCGEGRVLHMVDATADPWVHKYAKPHAPPDVLIGKSHVGRLAAPVWEAAQ